MNFLFFLFLSHTHANKQKQKQQTLKKQILLKPRGIKQQNHIAIKHKTKYLLKGNSKGHISRQSPRNVLASLICSSMECAKGPPSLFRPVSHMEAKKTLNLGNSLHTWPDGQVLIKNCFLLANNCDRPQTEEVLCFYAWSTLMAYSHDLLNILSESSRVASPAHPNIDHC